MNLFARFIPAGSTVLAVTTLGSYLMGLWRDRIFAQTFGASRLLDAYNAAFILPDFVFNIVVASGIAAAFVPIFTDLFKSRPEQAQAYARAVINASLIAMLFFGLILVIFAPTASALIAPGFNSADLKTVSELLRLLAISPLFFAISNTLGAMLVAKRRFLFYGLSPIFYNLGIISGALWLTPILGIKGVVLGTIGGAFLHLLIRVFDSRQLGFRFRGNFSWQTSEFKKTIQLMIPKMFGHPVELATFWGFTALASLLLPGSIAILNFARNFQSVPVSIVGIAVATAIFPSLAEAATTKSLVLFKSTLRSSFWLVFGASFLSAIVVILIREPLISLILGGKSFGPEAIQRTAVTLGIFALAIPSEASAQILVRAFYATKNTLWPVISSLIALAIALSGGWLLLPVWNLAALPLAFFAGSMIKLALLFLFLPRQWQFFD